MDASPTPSTGSTTANTKFTPRLTLRIRNYDDFPELERRVLNFGSKLHLQVYIIDDLTQDDIWEIERALGDLVTQVRYTFTFRILDEDPKVDNDEESVDSNSSNGSCSDAGNAGAAGAAGASGAFGGAGGSGGAGDSGNHTPLLVYGDCEGMFELMMQLMDLNKDSSNQSSPTGSDFKFLTRDQMEKISVFVEILIRKQQHIEAVRFICAYNLADKYQPVDLLQQHVDNAKLFCDDICFDETSCIEIKDKARDEEIASLGTVLQCISDNNIECEDLVDEVEHRIRELNAHKGCAASRDKLQL